MKAWTIASAVAVSLASAPGWATLHVDWAPSNPSAITPVSISAWREFPDPGQDFVSASYSLVGHTINMQVVLQDLHTPGSFWPAIVMEEGGTVHVNTLAAGAYQVNAQMFMIPWYGGLSYPYDSGTTTFVVTPEPTTLALLALGGLLTARRRRT